MRAFAATRAGRKPIDAARALQQRRRMRRLADAANPAWEVAEVRAETFTHAYELAAWIEDAGVDTSGWGRGGTKSVDDLLAEVRAGETSLHRDNECGVVRQLRVVKLVVRHPSKADHHLACTRQRMANGKTRRRAALMPSEKLFPGEEVASAAARCAREELSCLSERTSRAELDPPETLPGTWLVWHETVESPSFPALTTDYELHQIEVVLRGLPEKAFDTDEAGGKRHHWEWIEDTETQPRRAPAPSAPLAL